MPTTKSCQIDEEHCTLLVNDSLAAKMMLSVE